MEHKDIYLRFLSLLQSVEGTGELPALDLDAKRILETIAVRHLQGKPLTITEAMNLSSIASPATIHRKIDQLRNLNLVETMHEGSNRRTKFLYPTPLAFSYFDKVGGVMQKAAELLI